LSKSYFVYIIASRSRTLYVGVTSNLLVRQWQHASKVVDGFTKQYNVNRLVYFEETSDARSAIEREKQIKKWRREKKIVLIERLNPTWDDLAEGWTS
jgi:putative endonuclease